MLPLYRKQIDLFFNNIEYFGEIMFDLKIFVVMCHFATK